MAMEAATEPPLILAQAQDARDVVAAMVEALPGDDNWLDRMDAQYILVLLGRIIERKSHV